MAKRSKQQPTVNVAELQPDELNALKAVIKDFMTRAAAIDAEVELLKDDKKDLVEEFSEKLDVKTLKAALRVVKIQQGVEHKDCFDTFIEVLTDPVQ
jgi:uncharacterized protein (UPF0335 family)